MELKLVYRALRKLSEWTLVFFSEISVQGSENVPHAGPLIVASCHHNEILDIATLAVTIPHGRPLCFWAKSTMFANPITRAILSSSGSIPVKRNPNGSQAAANGDGHVYRQVLFRETFRALDAGEVVKDGASWAALEYVRWQRDHAKGSENAPKLLIVPVGIVPTDKTRYQSRVSVRWGAPIDVTQYADKYLSEIDGDSRAVVKDLSSEIERRMVALTINALDWDTLYAAGLARNILWQGDDNVPIEDFVAISQNLIDIISAQDGPPSLASARASLLAYHSLLQRASIPHSSLAAILSDTPLSEVPLTRGQAIIIFLRQLISTLVHPRFAFFIPPFLLHIPAYLLARLGKRALATPREEETHAQFKATFGWLGATMMYFLTGKVVLSAIASKTEKLNESGVHDLGSAFLLQFAQRLRPWLSSSAGLLRYSVCLAVTVYGSAFVLSKWHNALVGANYKRINLITTFRLTLLATSIKVMNGLLSPSVELSPEELALCRTPIYPPLNPFINAQNQDKSTQPPAATSETAETDPVAGHRLQTVSAHRLIRPLLAARSQVTIDLAKYFIESQTPRLSHPAVDARIRLFLEHHIP